MALRKLLEAKDAAVRAFIYKLMRLRLRLIWHRWRAHKLFSKARRHQQHAKLIAGRAARHEQTAKGLSLELARGAQ